MFSSKKPKQTYAFNQPNTANNSHLNQQKQERENFYQPLPLPINSSSPSSPSFPSSTNTNTNSNTQTNNPFEREYQSRTPSPHLSSSAHNPLLPSSNYSPVTPGYNRGTGTGTNSPIQSHNNSNMPVSRNYGPSARSAAGMPQRGDSQSALLGSGDFRQVR